MNQILSKLIIFVASITLITACNGKNKNDNHVQEMNTHKVEKVEKRETLEESSQTKAHSVHNNGSSSHHSNSINGVSPSVAFEKLVSGNERYQQGNLRVGGANQNDREKLIAGQHPHTIILSCSDSRVPPEIVFDQKLGDLFVVRTAGEALDNSSLASIEYAVDHLGVKLIVVMAHEYCGAVKAAFSTLNGADAGSPALNKLVEDIHPRIMSFAGHEPSNGFISEAKANAIGVAQDLLGRSDILLNKYNEKNLEVKTAIYHLNSGWVEFYSSPKNNIKLEKRSRGLASVTESDLKHHKNKHEKNNKKDTTNSNH